MLDAIRTLTDAPDLVAALLVITGVLASVLAAWANQAHWTAGRKRTVSAAVAVTLGVLVAIASQRLHGVPDGVAGEVSRFLVSIAAVLTCSQVFYLIFRGPLERLEAATSTHTPEHSEEDTP